MAQIKNILFDFGNVLIDIDEPETEHCFQLLLGEEFNRVFQELRAADIFHRYEVGELTEERFIWSVQQASSKPLLPRDVLDAWNGMLIGMPAHRFDFLRTIRREFRVFLFSNTNETHINWVHRYLMRTYEITDFEPAFFEQVFYSHLIGERKPDIAAFEKVVQLSGVDPVETLFIDDKPENVESARRAGLKAERHDPLNDIAEMFDSYILRNNENG